MSYNLEKKIKEKKDKRKLKILRSYKKKKKLYNLLLD